MDDQLSTQDKIALIKSHLQEILKPEIIEDVIVKQGRPLSIYWGNCISRSLERASSCTDLELSFSRYCYHRKTTLRLLRSYSQDRPLPARRMCREDSSGRHPWLPG